MALRALLLSPDDQAVNAITGVLEEMSVTCERPMDGMSAAKKLNSESFDLVLVDCENLPAAKLIFDVCRRAHGAASLPVAIVDGRVGLPTAFRLGAELILTKPVAKDQARITIRTAVSRVKKEQPVRDGNLADAAPDVETGHEEEQKVATPKAIAQAAAAGTTSTANNATVAAIATPPVSDQAAMPTRALASAAATPAVESTPVTSSTTAEIPATMPSSSLPAKPTISSVDPVISSKTPSGSARPTSAASPELHLSAHPVEAASEKNQFTLKSRAPSSVEQPNEKRASRLLMATLVLALAIGGAYAAWMYQPGFREFIEVRLDQARPLLGLQNQRAVSQIRQSVPLPAKAVAQQTPPPQAPVVVPAQASPAASAPNKSVTSPNASVPSEAASSPPDNSLTAESQKKIAAPVAPTSDFPEAKNAVILSSKGAEKRLLHRVTPVVSAEARAQSLEATVVLKAIVDENGAVRSVQPVEGDSALADAATKAVKQWRYKPFMRDGKALPFQTIVLVDFQ